MGWNMIGGYEDTVDAATLTTTPQDQIIFPIYKYIPGTGYQASSQIVPGYGYWLKVLSDCQINIPDVMTKGKQKTAQFFKNPLPAVNWGKIIITDAAGNRYTLYACKGNSDLTHFELPPLPPEGVFDIRYGSGRYVENCCDRCKMPTFAGLKGTTQKTTGHNIPIPLY